MGYLCLVKPSTNECFLFVLFLNVHVCTVSSKQYRASMYPQERKVFKAGKMGDWTDCFFLIKTKRQPSSSAGSPSPLLTTYIPKSLELFWAIKSQCQIIWHMKVLSSAQHLNDFQHTFVSLIQKLDWFNPEYSIHRFLAKGNHAFVF